MVKVEILEGDIAKVEADAIVTSAPTNLDMSTSVGKAIVLAGGKEIEEEAQSFAPISLGDAVQTKAGKLHAKFVIHAAAKDGRGDNRASAQSITDSLQRTLDLADELGCKTVALPALGCGEGKFPIKEGVPLLLKEIYRSRERHIERIKIVLFTHEGFEIAQREIRKYDDLIAT